MQEKVKELASQYLNDVIAIRRHMHMHPELSFKEFQTADYVWDQLSQLGINDKHRMAGTGIVALINGTKGPGKTIALRADMDALPVEEKNGLPFASRVKTIYNGKETSVMHACGHDAHVAILMGVAEVLAGMKKDLKGTVKFIFQPAEEGAPAARG